MAITKSDRGKGKVKVVGRTMKERFDSFRLEHKWPTDREFAILAASAAEKYKKELEEEHQVLTEIRDRKGGNVELWVRKVEFREWAIKVVNLRPSGEVRDTWFLEYKIREKGLPHEKRVMEEILGIAKEEGFEAEIWFETGLWRIREVRKVEDKEQIVETLKEKWERAYPAYARTFVDGGIPWFTKSDAERDAQWLRNKGIEAYVGEFNDSETAKDEDYKWKWIVREGKAKEEAKERIFDEFIVKPPSFRDRVAKMAPGLGSRWFDGDAIPWGSDKSSAEKDAEFLNKAGLLVEVVKRGERWMVVPIEGVKGEEVVKKAGPVKVDLPEGNLRMEIHRNGKFKCLMPPFEDKCGPLENNDYKFWVNIVCEREAGAKNEFIIDSNELQGYWDREYKEPSREPVSCELMAQKGMLHFVQQFQKQGRLDELVSVTVKVSPLEDRWIEARWERKERKGDI